MTKKIEAVELDEADLDQAQGAGLLTIPVGSKNGIAAASDQDLINGQPDGSIGEGWATAPVGV